MTEKPGQKAPYHLLSEFSIFWFIQAQKKRLLSRHIKNFSNNLLFRHQNRKPAIFCQAKLWCSQGPVKVEDKALTFVLGDIPFARCVKSPARSRAFPAGGGIRIPKTRPLRSELRVEDLKGLRQREFSAAPALRSAETGPRRFHKAPPGTSPARVCWTLTGP
jgi:hypothetical protein